MRIEIRPDPGLSYSLYVDGILRVSKESFAVCDKIRYHLQDPRQWEPTECCEIADKIRHTLWRHGER